MGAPALDAATTSRNATRAGVTPQAALEGLVEFMLLEPGRGAAHPGAEPAPKAKDVVQARRLASGLPGAVEGEAVGKRLRSFIFFYFYQ